MLYQQWDQLNCKGRIYIAREGINAQMSVPEDNIDDFLHQLSNTQGLNNMPIKWAIEDDGKSFYKLSIKVRPKIVADGLDDDSFDVTNVGKHLTPLEFHDLLEDPNTIVIDMRNHYESEIGHFNNAICPDVDTFREEITYVVDAYKDHKKSKILLYCTGGVRCEKASAYLKHNGFNDVNQLHGGIIAYAQEMKQKGKSSKFVGKNFVFDERLGESISMDVISKCHQCGKPSDLHTNCANNDCHLLFIQCNNCKKTYQGCCSNECRNITLLPLAEQKAMRSAMLEKYAGSQIFRSRIRPKLSISPNQ